MASLTLPSIFDLSPLDRANQQILAETERAEQQIKEEIFIAGEQLGEIIGTQRAIARILPNSNEELRSDVALLSKMQARELKTLASSWEAKNRLILEKLAALVLAVQDYTRKSKQRRCGALVLDVIPALQDVIDSIPSVDYQKLSLYPKRPPANGADEKIGPEFAVMLSVNPDQAIQVHPTVQNSLQLRREESQSLMRECKNLESTNLALLQEKKEMIAFHGPFLSKFNQEREKELNVKGVVEKVRSILGKINWGFRGTGYGGCLGCPHNNPNDFSPPTIRHWHDATVRQNLSSLEKLHKQTMGIFASLELMRVLPSEGD